MYLKCLYLRSCFLVLYSVQWYMHNVHIKKKLSLRAAVVAIIESSMLGVSDWWICNIIRHSSRFSSVEALSAVIYLFIY